jgi:uncharacterized membrane protein YfcA
MGALPGGSGYRPHVSPADLALAALIVLGASALQGAVGFGSSLVAAPLLVLIDPVFVPGPLVAIALLLNALMMWRDREPVAAKHIGLAVVGRVPGSVLGALALVSIPAGQLSLFFGALVLFAVFLSFGGFHVRPTSPAIVAAGTLSGFMGTAVSIGGPPIALLYQHEDGPQFRSTVSRLLIYGAIISLATLAAFGEFGREEAVATAILLPSVVVGFAISGPVARHLDRGHTRKAILAVSALSALAVVVKAAA